MIIAATVSALFDFVLQLRAANSNNNNNFNNVNNNGNWNNNNSNNNNGVSPDFWLKTEQVK